MEKPHPAYVHVLPLGSWGFGEGEFFHGFLFFSLSALLHSFIFFPFVTGTFLSPSCLPLPWGQLSGMDGGLSPGSQDSGPCRDWDHHCVPGTLLGAHVC